MPGCGRDKVGKSGKQGRRWLMTTMMRMISRSLVWVKVTVRITPLFFPSRDSSSLPVRLFLDRGFFLLLLQTATLIHFYAAVRVTYLFCLLLRFFGHLFFPFFFRRIAKAAAHFRHSGFIFSLSSSLSRFVALVWR